MGSLSPSFPSLSLLGVVIVIVTELEVLLSPLVPVKVNTQVLSSVNEEISKL